MLKSTFISFFLILFISGIAFPQEDNIDPVKFKKIKKEIKKKKSPFYYPNLFQRYLELDTTLNMQEFRYLYYGFTFQDEYSPYATPGLRDSLVNFLKREELMAIEYAMTGRIAGDLLKESPFRLRETFIAAVVWEMAGELEMSRKYYHMFETQVEAIMSSGDGLEQKSAFVVIYIPDEYEMVEVLGFKFGMGQALLDDGYDRLNLEDNPYGITELYFNVQRLMEVGFR